MKAIDAAVQHAEWLCRAWEGVKPNSQVGEYAHKFDETLKALYDGLLAEQKTLAAAKPETPAKAQKE